MKNLFKALALLLVLMTVETAIVSCAELDAVGSVGKGDADLTGVDVGNEQTVDTGPDGGEGVMEFHSNDPDWRLYWEDYYLKLTNGEKTFVYGDYKGEESIKYAPYMLNFHAYDESAAELIVSEDKTEAIILYDGVRYTVDQPAIMYASVVELENGTIIQDAVPRSDQFLEAHGYTYEALMPYHAGSGNNGLEYSTYEITLTAEYREGKPYFEGRLLTFDGVLDLSMVVGRPYNIGEDFKSLKCDSSAKTLMTAFIEKDTETLETFFNYEKGLLDPYKTLEFGGYKATVTDSGKVLFTVEVTKSDLDTIPVGEHIYELSSGMNGYTMLDLGKNYNNRVTTKAEQFVHAWFANPYFEYEIIKADEVESTNLPQYSFYIFDFLAGYLRGYEDGSLKRDDYIEAAERIFGLNYHVGFYSVFNESENGTLTYANGHGGAHYNYDFVESSNTYVIVQFYADENYTIKSHLVRYDFEDGKYLKVVSTTILEEANYKPYRVRT
ncbi:MAG: hypothetical protein IKL24_00625 [Clostridia bacterium]|nr:hypothetical protein [Clostridia bacterium]